MQVQEIPMKKLFAGLLVALLVGCSVQARLVAALHVGVTSDFNFQLHQLVGGS
jgi:type IV pilus biogenesis protein CpaD/CtpE